MYQTDVHIADVIGVEKKDILQRIAQIDQQENVMIVTK